MIDDVPALKVIPVIVIFHDAPLAAVIVMVLAPSVSALVVDPVEENSPHEFVVPFVFNVPAVNVTVEVTPHVNPSDNSHDPPAPLNVTFPNVFPADVTVN